jgi:hypothetical protein
VGPHQRTRGSSPRSPAGVCALLQGFYRGIMLVGVVRVPIGISNVSAGFGDARATGTIRVRCIPGGVAVRRAPEPGPIEAIGVSSSSCFKRALVVPPRDGG